MNLRPLRPERSALAKLSYSPANCNQEYRDTRLLGCRISGDQGIRQKNNRDGLYLIPTICYPDNLIT